LSNGINEYLWPTNTRSYHAVIPNNGDRSSSTLTADHQLRVSTPISRLTCLWYATGLRQHSQF
jgi:hypothetical protein